MRRNEDIYKRIYTKTLERKNEMSKINNLRTNVFTSQFIERGSYLDFPNSRKNLIPRNSAVVYLYDDILSDKTIIDRKSIIPSTVYKLADFSNRTKVGVLLFDETGLIDPEIISVYVTDMNTTVFIVNKHTSSYISVIYLKGIRSYTRYNNNIDVNIPTSYKNSFIVWTKLDNSNSAAVEWISPIITNGQYQVPIRAQGKYSVLMLADNFRFYNIIPSTNSEFSYINFPEEIGYTNLNNIFLWKNRTVGFSQPISHTPLYDGFKVAGDTGTPFLVGFSKRIEFASKYTDLLHEYNKHKNYMSEYLSDTLPIYIKNYTPYVPNINLDIVKSEFQDRMVTAYQDYPNYLKEYLEEISSIKFTEYNITSGNPILITNHDLRKRLLFINGINISPISSSYNTTTKKWTSLFKSTDIIGTKIVEVDTGLTYTPYWEGKTITTQNIVIGPTTNINSQFQFDIFELNKPTDAQATLTLVDISDYTYTIDENILKLTFTAGMIGKTIYVCERRYNQFISDGYSKDGLIQKLPAWVSFLPKERMFIFLNGRLLERDRFYLFDRFRYNVVKGDTIIATDLDTNTIDGEIFNGYFTTEFEMIEYNVSLSNGSKIVTLNDKGLPFSKKYNLVFVDGKLIHPNDIKEIDNYRFSIATNSTNNMCILRKKLDFAEKQKFSNVKDKWTQYLETLNITQLENLIGPLNTINSGENNTRSVYLTERHLFEILYHCCLKNREQLHPDDEIWIPIELPGVLLSDGRIPISTMRSGPYPRYFL